MDDWQDAAFSNRHMHNRNAGNNKTNRKAFDVRKTFGSYTVKCAAWQKIVDAATMTRPKQTATLELYRLTENDQGILGELHLPEVLHAAAILAASRISLRTTVLEMESALATDDDMTNDENDDEPLEEDEDLLEQNRLSTFEKNSFRSPKFWMQWSGQPSGRGCKDSTQQTIAETGLGYFVFSGNDCRRFKGTLNCSSLGWKDVAITGHKLISRGEADTKVNWMIDNSNLGLE
ncbi:hypothetical protein ACN47E_000945 [Coniothyrium glycines]